MLFYLYVTVITYHHPIITALKSTRTRKTQILHARAAKTFILREKSYHKNSTKKEIKKFHTKIPKNMIRARFSDTSVHRPITLFSSYNLPNTVAGFSNLMSNCTACPQTSDVTFFPA